MRRLTNRAITLQKKHYKLANIIIIYFAVFFFVTFCCASAERRNGNYITLAMPQWLLYIRLK